MTVQGATHSQGHNDWGEQIYTLPETNSSNLKLNGLEYDRFLLGLGLFSGANC